MALPILTTPTYELEVPSTDEKIKYRPFLVKEEKVLLIALESGENSQIVQAIKTIVDECTFNKLPLGRMPMFDIEYIFLQIRSKAVGEVSKLSLLCPDDNTTYANVEVNLADVEVEVHETHDNKIQLTDDMGMIMTYPTIDSFLDGKFVDITAENMIDVVASCVLQIYEKKGEVVYDAKDSTKLEMVEFIENLNSKQFKDIQNFFDSMPVLKHTVTIVNPKTKIKSEIILKGLNDFFV
jgi:hypothetical protein